MRDPRKLTGFCDSVSLLPYPRDLVITEVLSCSELAAIQKEKHQQFEVHCDSKTSLPK